MSPGNARLWTGIGCVGTLVTMAATMLAADAPSAMFATTPGNALSEYVAILAFFIVAAGLLLPFDFIGGMLIPTAFEGQTPKFGLWLRQWIRSVGIQLLFYCVTFFFYLQIGREIGAPALVVMFAALQIALVAGQELIWQAVTGQRAGNSGDGELLFVPHSDQRFAGGITGLQGIRKYSDAR